MFHTCKSKHTQYFTSFSWKKLFHPNKKQPKKGNQLESRNIFKLFLQCFSVCVSSTSISETKFDNNHLITLAFLNDRWMDKTVLLLLYQIPPFSTFLISVEKPIRQLPLCCESPDTTTLFLRAKWIDDLEGVRTQLIEAHHNCSTRTIEIRRRQYTQQLSMPVILRKPHLFGLLGSILLQKNSKKYGVWKQMQKWALCCAGSRFQRRRRRMMIIILLLYDFVSSLWQDSPPTELIRHQ